MGFILCELPSSFTVRIDKVFLAGVYTLQGIEGLGTT